MNHLERYARQQLAQLRLRLRSFYDTREQEDLHQARLSLKRLRAVSTFVTLSGFPCKDMEATMKKLRKDLRQLGEARNAHVMLEKSRDIGEEATPEFRKQLEKKFRKAMSGLPSRHSMEQTLMSAVLQLEESGTLCFESAGKADFRKAFDAQVTAIRSRYLGAKRDEDFHELRRMLKEARYFLEFMPPHQHGPDFTMDIEERLHQSEELLGAWHDMVVMRDHALKGGTTLQKEEQRRVIRDIDLKVATYLEMFHVGMRNSGLLQEGVGTSRR